MLKTRTNVQATSDGTGKRSNYLWSRESTNDLGVKKEIPNVWGTNIALSDEPETLKNLLERVKYRYFNFITFRVLDTGRYSDDDVAYYGTVMFGNRRLCELQVGTERFRALMERTPLFYDEGS